MLPQVEVIVTTHNDDGKAVFSSSPVSGPLQGILVSNGKLRSNIVYSTNTFPPVLDNEVDIETHAKWMQTQKVGIVSPGGTLFGIVDFAPGFNAPHHRTESIDYGVILEGEVELTLDDGKARVLAKGDVFVLRATNHAWRNTSDKQWARLSIVTQEAQPPKVGGQELRGDMGEAKNLLDQHV